MDEIHRWVGLQNVTPGAFAGVRLAGYEEHAESIANAVDDERCAIVVERELLWSGFDLNLDDVRSAVIDWDVEPLIAPDR